MMDYQLNETWSWSSTDHDEFASAVADLRERTEFLFPAPEEMEFLLINNIVNGELNVASISKPSILRAIEEPTYGVAVKKHIACSNLNMELLSESDAFYPLFVRIDGGKRKRIYYTSAMLMPCIMSALSLGDTNPIENFNVLRMADIASVIYSQNKHFLLVARSAENENGKTERKIFAALSDAYAPTDIELLPDAGLHLLQTYDGVVRSCYMDQDLIREHIEFPHLASKELPDKLIPGIELSTSDTGHSSFSLRVTYRFADSDVASYGTEKQTVRFTHRTPTTWEEITDALKKLMNTLSIVPNSLKKRTEKKPIDDMLLQRIRKQMEKSGMEAALNKKRSTKVAGKILTELVDLKSVSDYDVIKRLADVPVECEGLSDTMVVKLREAVFKAC